MKPNRVRLAGTVIAAAAAIFLASASSLSAQVNMTGAWAMTVDVDGAISNPELTLEQDGMSLTGSYSSEQLGQADVTGSVDGNTVTVMFEADLQGQVIGAEYSGTVDAEGNWSGIFDLSGFVSGTFTATKQ